MFSHPLFDLLICELNEIVRCSSNTDFSLTDWMTSHSIDKIENIQPPQASELLLELGLDHFLSEPERCTLMDEKYRIGDSNGWNTGKLFKIWFWHMIIPNIILCTGFTRNITYMFYFVFSSLSMLYIFLSADECLFCLNGFTLQSARCFLMTHWAISITPISFVVLCHLHVT